MNNFQSNKSAMHKAVCDECGVSCEVPFKPSGDKPIFCSNCFADKRPDSSHRGDRPNRRDDFKKRDFRDKEMFKAVCDQCGVNCEVPFKPSGGKPVFCNNCFGKGGNKHNNVNSGRGDNKQPGGMSKSSENLNAKFEMLNAKVDKIMAALNISNKPKEEKTEVVEVKSKAVKKSASSISQAKKEAKKSVSKAVKNAAKAAAKPRSTKKAPVKKKAPAKKKK